MPESLNTSLANLPLTRLGQAAAVIGQALGQGCGVRLGQSTVLSTKVHAFDSHSPEHVQIMLHTDAGQVFYHRQDSGTIFHLDIFHECGEVDHRVVANFVRLAIEIYRKLAIQQADLLYAGLINPDFVDIQTATGGGRITGNLQGGQKLAVRKVHENHVHVALRLPPGDLLCLFYIVAAAETAILDLGLEPRCNELISYVDSVDCRADLSPYTDQTDSLLTGQPSGEQNEQTVLQKTETGQSQYYSSPRDSACSGQPASASHQPIAGGRGQTLIGVKDFKSDKSKMAKSHKTALVANGCTASFYAAGLYDSFKQAVNGVQNRSGATTSKQKTNKDVGKKKEAAGSHSHSAGIDVAATVGAVAERLLAEGMTGRLRISAADIRFSGRRQRNDNDICLLADSSGSMAGLRLQAAQYLAEEISRFGCSRLSLVTFQDNQATVIRPFINSKQAVLGAFAEITPNGATPLALGIRRSLAYIKEQQAKKPLLVLITDGVPSRRYDENVQPQTDALIAAAEIKQANCGFLCIGLDSDDGFLKKLTAAAGGVAYMFTEFEKQLCR